MATKAEIYFHHGETTGIVSFETEVMGAASECTTATSRLSVLGFGFRGGFRFCPYNVGGGFGVFQVISGRFRLMAMKHTGNPRACGPPGHNHRFSDRSLALCISSAGAARGSDRARDVPRDRGEGGARDEPGAAGEQGT